jgi:hypothetical protein
MRLTESEKANPQDYFLQSGVDQLGNPIYKDVNQEVTDYAPAKAFRKKVFDGDADIVVLADTVQIYWKENLVAEAQLEGQVETSPGNWQGQLFSFQDANISKITEIEGEDPDGNPIMVPVTPFFRAYEVKDIPALGITDAVFGMDVHWAFKDTKLSFYLDAPGFNARIRWQCRVKDSAVAWTDTTDPDNPVYHKGLSFNVADYEGAVNHGNQADPEPGWTQHWWTFEPDGKQIDVTDTRTPLERYEQGVGLVVDPYLSVDEQSTYIDVYCDGFVYRVQHNSQTGEFANIRNAANDTELANVRNGVQVSSTIYRVGYDNDLVATVIENTPNRVVIKSKGNYETSGQSTLTNSDWVEIIQTIYPDRIFFHLRWSSSAAITLDNDSGGDNRMIAFAGLEAEFTNETSIYENAGSESTGNGEHNTADYIGLTSDELNIIGVKLYESIGSGFIQYNHDSFFEVYLTYNNVQKPSGIDEIKAMWILDFAEREGSAKIYDETDRLALGDQYKDLEIDLTEGGSRVFDDGSSQYLRVMTTPPVTAAPLSLFCWYKLNSIPDTNSWHALFSVEESNVADENAFYLMLYDSSGTDRLTAGIVAAGSWSETNINITHETTSWHAAGGRYINSTSRYAFHDGSWSSENTNSRSPSGLDSIVISGITEGGGTPGNNFDGKIAHAAIWDVALTTEEFDRLYAGALPTEIRPEALVAYWPLIDDDNDPIGGYNMTPYNSPTWSTTDYPDVFKPDKGKWEIQDILPATIDESGFQSDGAWHIVVDSNDEAKFTLDRTRIRPATVIHDWPFQYGSVESPTSILLNHLKMDDNAANNELKAEVGPDGSWHAADDSDRNTDNDSVTDAIRGRALDTQNGAAFGKLAVGSATVHDNDYFIKGSWLLKVKFEFNYNDGLDQAIMEIAYDGTNRIYLWYDSTDDYFEMGVKWNNSSTYITAPTFTENYSLQRYYNCLLSWDASKNFMLLAFDGQVIGTAVKTDTPTSNHPANFHVGTSYGRGSDADIIIDEIKTFSEAVLPYGAYFIGNGSGLLADIDNPHADLTWFFDGQAAAAKGGANLASDKNPTNSGGSFVTTDPIIGTNHWDSNGATNVLTVAESSEDIVDYNNGFVAGWFNVQSFSGGEYLIDVRDADGSDRISAVLDASGNIDVTYRSQSTDEAITGDIAITAGKWFFLKITWDDNGEDKKVHSYINGQENGTPHTIANTWGGGTGLTWYFTEDYNGANGVDAFIQTLWMGKKANVPEIWTAFGKPLHVPLVDLQ